MAERQARFIARCEGGWTERLVDEHVVEEPQTTTRKVSGVAQEAQAQAKSDVCNSKPHKSLNQWGHLGVKSDLLAEGKACIWMSLAADSALYELERCQRTTLDTAYFFFQSLLLRFLLLPSFVLTIPFSRSWPKKHLLHMIKLFWYLLSVCIVITCGKKDLALLPIFGSISIK